jgi:cold-inducible RNA-binding protein
MMARRRLASDQKGGAISSKVFVGNLSFETTSSELETVCAEFGEVVGVVVPTDRMSGRPRGFAFVEFASPEAATAAIEKLDGYELSGRRLRVNEASQERPARPGAGGFGRSFAGADRPARRPSRPKGSRRNLRGRKRSIW